MYPVECSTSVMTEAIPDKVRRYEIFVNDVLKEDLKKIHYKREKVLLELAELGQLKSTLESYIELNLDEGFKSQMSLGCDFYVQANVTDTRTIFIDIGLGYYLEFPLKAAIKYVERKSELLQQHLSKFAQDTADIKARIKIVLGGIEELTSSKVK